MEFCLRLSTFALFIHLTFCHIIVYKRNQTIEEFYDLPAQFGPSLPTNGLRVYVVTSRPKDACTLPQLAPIDPEEPSSKFVLVIARTNCTFEDKVRNAQNAGYDAAIVYNIGSDDLEQMSAKNGADIKIPSVFVGETTGSYITEEYFYESGFSLVINDELPFNINTHLILPFSILVGLCFIIMIVYMIYKCAREQRRLRQHRLPKRLLKKIPTIKFTKGLPYETCVICLDEYVEGDKLRVLPCQHAYHCGCIDTWLTKNRRVCPICKRKVFPKGSESSRRSRRRPVSSDSMSDSETDDTTPLINSHENNIFTNHGTFNPLNNLLNSSNANNENGPNNGNDNRQASNEQNNDSSNNRQNQGRPNPFDRLPSSNSNNSEQDLQNISRGIFSIFRFFRRNRTPHIDASDNNAVENPINAVLESTVRSIAVNLPPRPSSNNVLNTNLSGSFHGEGNAGNNDSDENDGQTERRTIYEPIDQSTTAITTTTNQMESSTDPSVFIQTPPRGGIGVAALPNTSFQNDRDNNRRESGSNRRGRGSNRRDGSLFIV